MAVKTKVVNPVRRTNSYPDQKSIHPSDLSFSSFTLSPLEIKRFQLVGRTILYPILKRIYHPNYQWSWVDAIGDIEVIYDDNLEFVTLKNLTSCVLDIKVKIV